MSPDGHVSAERQTTPLPHPFYPSNLQTSLNLRNDDLFVQRRDEPFSIVREQDWTSSVDRMYRPRRCSVATVVNTASEPMTHYVSPGLESSLGNT